MMIITENLVELSFKMVHTAMLIKKHYGIIELNKLLNENKELKIAWDLFNRTKNEVDKEFKTKTNQ